MEDPRVKANVYEDEVFMIKAGPVPTWEVTVYGVAPHEHRRTYTVKMKTAKDAAFDAINQFVEEMQNLHSGDQ